MERLEMAAGNILTYQECGEITCQVIDCMRTGLVANLDDPDLIAEILDEMTTHANKLLEPTGLAIGWRMP